MVRFGVDERDIIIFTIAYARNSSGRVWGSEGETRARFKEGVRFLILPFIQLLGYDTSDPLEVWPEYSAGFNRAQEKVDYALFKDETIVMLVEAKPVKDDLVAHNDQLSKYFNATPDARFGIMTNGLRYRFYSDLTSPNLIDKAPFFEFNFETMSDNDIDVLEGFRRDAFDRNKLVSLAEELAYSSKMKPLIVKLLRNPSDELIRLLVKQIDPKARVNRSVLDRYREITKNAITDAMVDMFRQGVVQKPDMSLGPDERTATNVPSPPDRQAEQTPDSGKRRRKVYEEGLHFEGKPQSVVRLYRHIDDFIKRLEPTVEKKVRAKTINYCVGRFIFCSVHLTKSGLRIWLPLHFQALADPPAFVRDVSNVGHWGVGDVEVRVDGFENMDLVENLIRKSHDART